MLMSGRACRISVAMPLRGQHPWILLISCIHLRPRPSWFNVRSDRLVLDNCPRLRLEETTMTVVDSDEPNTELSVQDAFDRSKFPTASDRRTFETEPVFTAVSILAGAHLHCVVSSLKFTVLATDRLARTQVKLLGQGRLSEPHEFPVQL